MPETTQFTYKHKELVEILVKAQGLNEGILGLFVRLGLGASNVGTTEDQLQPAAIIPILEIGLQRMEKRPIFSVDAAKVNPKMSLQKGKKVLK